MSPSGLNRKLRALELTDPREAVRLETLSVATTLFSFFSGDSDEVVLATRTAALGHSAEGLPPNSAAVSAARAYVEGRPTPGFERQSKEVRAVLFPLNFKPPGN